MYAEMESSAKFSVMHPEPLALSRFYAHRPLPNLKRCQPPLPVEQKYLAPFRYPLPMTVNHGLHVHSCKPSPLYCWRQPAVFHDCAGFVVTGTDVTDVVLG